MNCSRHRACTIVNLQSDVLPMDRLFLLMATLLAALATYGGWRTLKHGVSSRGTLLAMVGVMAMQLCFLDLRGQWRGACPLGDLGEIMAFLAWTLTLCYLLVGRSFRASLVGLFTAPLVLVFQLAALWPGLLESHPLPKLEVDWWREAHAAVSMLAYGAYALAAVTGVMFLVLDHQLKQLQWQSSLFQRLPPVRELLRVMLRLLWTGFALLSLGLIAGGMMTHRGGWSHLLAAVAVWFSYGGVLIFHQWHGLTGRRCAWAAVVLFISSLLVFARL